jgi:hypothetical protein
MMLETEKGWNGQSKGEISRFRPSCFVPIANEHLAQIKTTSFSETVHRPGA